MKGKFLKTMILVTTIMISSSMASFKVASADVGSRLEGNDRYATSKAISGKFEKSDVAIIVRGETYPDALSATTLAKNQSAPIVLTESNKLNYNAESELKRLGVKKVFIVGGKTAINSTVEEKIKGMGIIIERIGGEDRYSTAVDVAKKIGVEKGIFVTTGLNFADALSVGPIAANLEMPIVLVAKDNISDDLNNLIKDNKIEKTYVVGGNSAISDDIVDKFHKAERIDGANRYATNKALVEKFNSTLKFDNAYVATGYNFPDALAGGALAAKNNNPIILTHETPSEETLDIIRSNNIKELTILGGTTAISNETVGKLNSKPEINTKCYKSGTYKVGQDIPAGEYLVKEDDELTYVKCTSDSTGNDNSLLWIDMVSGNSYITVNNGEYLELKGGNMYSVAGAPSIIPPDGLYKDGMYKVGKDIPAGEYKVKVNSASYLNAITVYKNSSHRDDSVASIDMPKADTYITVSDGQYLKLLGVEIQK